MMFQDLLWLLCIMDLICYLSLQVKSLPLQTLFKEDEIPKSYSLWNEVGRQTMILITS
jgi:hypothetical protein